MSFNSRELSVNLNNLDFPNLPFEKTVILISRKIEPSFSPGPALSLLGE